MADHPGDDATPDRGDADDPPAKKAAKKAAGKRGSKKATPAKKGAAKKATAKKATVKKAAAKKATAKKATAAKKTAAKKQAAKTAKATGKKATKQAAAPATPNRTGAPGQPAAAPERGDPPDVATTVPWRQAYPPNVPAAYETPAVTLTRLLDDAAADFPDNEALQFMGASTTYRQLVDHVDRFASALAGLGIRRGDRVAVVLPNCPQHVVAVCAAWRLGATAAVLDPDVDDEALSSQLEEVDAKAAVCLDPRVRRVAALAGRLPSLEHVITTGVQDALPVVKKMLYFWTGRRRGSGPVKIAAGEAARMSDLIERTVPAPPPVDVDPARAVALVAYTRGTTGSPKPVRLTHANVVAATFQTRLWIPDVQAGGENVFTALPLWHAAGLISGLGLSLLSGAVLTLLPRTEAVDALETIDRRRPTLLVGTPSTYEAVVTADNRASYDLTSLRVCLSFGAPLEPEVASAFESASGAKVRQAYGLTEAGSFTHANPVYGKAKAGTVGLALTNTTCSLRQLADPARPSPAGELGELAVAGPQVMAGYDHRPQQTAAALVQGWLLTGDVVTIDEEGYVTFVDRKHDVIDVGGHHVAPSEVESALCAHPAVRRAAVAGIGDAAGAGADRVAAYVILADDADASDDELLAFLGRRLAPHKLPQQITFLAELPETSTGTIRRAELAGG